MVDSKNAFCPQNVLNCDGEAYKTSKSKTKNETRIPTKIPESHYNLRSLDKKPEAVDTIGGIGMEIPQASRKKTRGRKSLLSKAQVKAKYDMEDGKQMSISGVLRAAKPCEKVSK